MEKPHAGRVPAFFLAAAALDRLFIAA